MLNAILRVFPLAEKANTLNSALIPRFCVPAIEMLSNFDMCTLGGTHLLSNFSLVRKRWAIVPRRASWFHLEPDSTGKRNTPYLHQRSRIISFILRSKLCLECIGNNYGRGDLTKSRT